MCGEISSPKLIFRNVCLENAQTFSCLYLYKGEVKKINSFDAMHGWLGRNNKIGHRREIFRVCYRMPITIKNKLSLSVCISIYKYCVLVLVQHHSYNFSFSFKLTNTAISLDRSTVRNYNTSRNRVLYSPEHLNRICLHGREKYKVTLLSNWLF